MTFYLYTAGISAAGLLESPADISIPNLLGVELVESENQPGPPEKLFTRLRSDAIDLWGFRDEWESEAIGYWSTELVSDKSLNSEVQKWIMKLHLNNTFRGKVTILCMPLYKTAGGTWTR